MRYDLRELGLAVLELLLEILGGMLDAALAHPQQMVLLVLDPAPDAPASLRTRGWRSQVDQEGPHCAASQRPTRTLDEFLHDSTPDLIPCKQGANPAADRSSRVLSAYESVG